MASKSIRLLVNQFQSQSVAQRGFPAVYFAGAWRKKEEMTLPATPVDLVDLKMLPSWVNEPTGKEYADFEGEDERTQDRRGSRPPRGRDREQRSPRARPTGDRRQRPERRDGPRRREDHREQEAPAPPPAVSVRFLPHPPALENVIAQIKSGSVAYSVFALARLFLEKPERYDVRLIAGGETSLYQMGETGAAAADNRILESNAFAVSKDDFYDVQVTQMEPVKGNFANVARCRLSGTLLGPTNHHAYQPQLRGLYEQRFSRRMSFAEYQKQIEIVNDPAAVEQWKEQARNVTTYTTKSQDPPVTFNTAAEAERHFRQNHLPSLIRSTKETIIDGVLSRRLPDRALGRVIEDAWARETRSPSNMMQELAGATRQAGLHIFRHRRGMIFVTPIRMRPFAHERAAVSPLINSILEKLSTAPGISRKKLAEELLPAEGEPSAQERSRLGLASDLHWLISEGHVIEFNDGSLDLPRVKVPEKAKPAVVPEGETAAEAGKEPAQAEVVTAVTPKVEEPPEAVVPELMENKSDQPQAPENP